MATLRRDGMNFESLRISRKQYGDTKGMLEARLHVKVWENALDIEIPADVATEIMRMCAPAIAASVNVALSDIARTSEAFLIESQVDGAAEELADGIGEGQIDT